MRPRLKMFVSWFVTALGFLVGFFALAGFGMAWPPFNDDLPGWLLRWISYLGGAFLGPVLLAGSIVALRNRKRAGIIFLICMPITVFCLAYPSAGYLVWHSDGGGWFEPPEPPTAIGLTIIFFLPIFAALLAIRYRKRAIYLFGATVVLAGIVFGLSHWTKAFLPPFGGWSALFLLFGLFWRGTGNRGWPSLFQPRLRPLRQRAAAFVFTCIAVLCVDICVTLGLSALGSSLFSGDCRGKPLFVHPESPFHAVFTARVILVGRSIEALTRDRGLFRDPHIPGARDPHVGDWAIGVVEERFWGLPSWSRLVLLTNFIYWKDAAYFVDGSRGRGLLTRVLPIVEGRVSCSRTKPVQDAIVDLRALRDAPSASGRRLIGYVRQPEKFVCGIVPPAPPKPAVGARISLVGPIGERIVTADESGTYEVDDLPPGDYTLRLLVPDSQLVGFWEGDALPAKVHLDSQGLVEHNFEIFWNGRIEGHVREDSGTPVRVDVELQNADGNQMPGNVRSYLPSNDDGSYGIKKIPPGRYFVVLNPSGPNDRSPFNTQYYQSAFRTQDAQVFQIGEGQKIEGVNFKVPRLAERTVQVRVNLQNGKEVPDVPVCVAYEHTRDYGTRACTNFIARTDRNGVATIHLFGNSQVRLFAEQYVTDEKSKRMDTYSSNTVESEAGKIPEKIDLVLNSSKP